MIYRQTLWISHDMQPSWTWHIMNYEFTPGSYSYNGRYKLQWTVDWNLVDWVIQMLSSTNFRLYSCKVTQNGTPYFDFVPCYRKSDWVAWVYDLINDVFYTNQWSWDFKKWPPVNVPYNKITNIYIGDSS